MADPRFFNNVGPFTLKALAEKTGAVLADPSAADFPVVDVSALDVAGDGHLSFLDNRKYREAFQGSRASAAFVAPALKSLAPAGMRLLLTETPYKAYALAAQMFYPDPLSTGVISPDARVARSAKLEPGVQIEAGAVIQSGAHIGANTIIDSNAVVGRNVVVGKNTRIGANASLSNCVIGDFVQIYPGVRIGQDGFGFAIDPAGYVKVPQLGRVIIEDHVEIGANSTIDRGAGPDTVIGMGTWIDNLVQIGHNVRIGKGCIIVAQVGISGSTVLEDYVVLGGQVGVAGHLRLGRGARIAAQSGIMRDVPPKVEYMGSPAVPIKQFMRQTAALARLVRRKGLTDEQ